MTRPASVVQPIRVGVSACLLGREVRWDGGHKRDEFLARVLGRHVEWVPVCPEVELGLGVPREPIQLEGDPEGPRLIAPGTGRDLTETMAGFAERRLTELARLDLSGYVLKKNSPSCGKAGVPVHGRKGLRSRRGTGVFAAALMARFPLLPVEEEDRLHDPARRANFVERVFGYARWRRTLAAGMTHRRLVAFHTAHELLLLAHAPAAYRRLGVLVANTKRRPLPAVAADYGVAFMRALGAPATPSRHANVLARMLGHLTDRIDAHERRELTRMITEYRRNRVQLVAPLTLFGHHVRRLRVASLARQVYLEPYPRELMLTLAPRRSPRAR